MAKAVGIDIGSKSLKILELEGTGSKYKITRFFNREIPFGSENSAQLLAEAIRSIFTENRLEQDNLALSIPTQDCIIREFTVDFVEEVQIRQTIKYEAEKYLHSYEIDEVIVDYRKIETLEGKTRLFVAAVPKKIISQRLELLKQCNLDPILIDIDIMPLVNTARFCTGAEEKETLAIIDFGAGSTKIVILHKGQLRHVRAIRLGASISEEKKKKAFIDPNEKMLPESNSIDWDIEDELIVSLPSPDGIDLDRMVLVKKEKNIVPEMISQQQKKKAIFERFVKEIKRTMLTLHLEKPVDMILLTGGGAQIEGLQERIKETFGIETVVLDFCQKISNSVENEEELALSGTVPFGLSVELMDSNSQMMNFRKEEYSYTNRFELIKFPLAILASMILLLFMILAYHVQNQRVQREKEYNQLIEKANIVWERCYPDQGPLPGTKFDKIYAFLDKIKMDVEDSAPKVPLVTDGFFRWKILFENFAKVRNRRYITIDKFILQPVECVFEGEAQDDETLDVLTRVIRQIEQDVEPNPDKTRVLSTARNTNPSDKPLNRRYRFQVGFKGSEN